MAKFITVQGTTSLITHIFVQDATSTSGAGLTGLSFSASGFLVAYIRPGDTAHSLVTKTGSGLNLGTYVSGAWLQVNSGTMPGLYEFHIPNAAVTSGAGRVVFFCGGNASMAPTPFEIDLHPANGLFTPILAATTHSGATIPIVSTVSRVLLTDTCSTSIVNGSCTVISISASAVNAAAFALNAIDISAFSQTAADKVFSSNAASFAELSQGAPPKNPRPDQALMAQYMALRNQVVVNATVMSIANSGGTVIFKKTLSDDGSTFTEAEAVTGP